MLSRFAKKTVDLEWLNSNFPCMMACPAHTNAGRYATLIAENRFEGAYRFARDLNPLASICRRVCGTPWYLGAMTFGTFMILVITGGLLEFLPREGTFLISTLFVSQCANRIQLRRFSRRIVPKENSNSCCEQT